MLRESKPRGVEIVGAAPPTADVKLLPAERLTVGYVRVSSVRETRQVLSPETQALVIRDFCRLNGLGVPQIVVERGSAATVRRRPELVRILEMCRADQVAHVVVQDLTRLFRDMREAVNIFAEMEHHHGVAFHSANRPALDTTTADGEFVRGLDVLLGQRERRQIGERTSRVLRATKQVTPEMARQNPALAYMAAHGLLTNAEAPTGYRWLGRKAKRKLVKDPVYYPVVERILAMRAAGLGYRRIKAALNLERIRTPHGNWWTTSTVAGIIARETEGRRLLEEMSPE
jgi:DNA invertase Pin-like site-specific DNA recombinase